jgi:polyhydroxyalkanoate synthesis repressor PhaR
MGGNSENQAAGVADPETRVIKRYSNRKLYDTKDSRYVTLQQIGEMVRRGENVRIIDNKTKEDKTEVTLALILSEDVKSKPQSVPLGTLRTLIQERGERLLSQLREGPIGRLIPGGPAAAPDSEPPASDADKPGARDASAPAPDKAAAAEDKQPSAAMARVHELVDASRKAMDQLQSTFDERVRELVPGVGLVNDLRTQVDALTHRVEALEARIGKLEGKS